MRYDDALPIAAKRDEIKAALEKSQVVVIAGETGSGKTTQLPKICLEIGRGVHGLIGHTQPRRLAARSVATRVAEEIGTPLGELVGYQVRFEDQSKDGTLIKLMTDGILLAETQHDRFLEKYDTIIVDEAHERSLNIDFLLGYLKTLLPRRPDLKLIITSATIDLERFSKHFNGAGLPDAPIIEVSGRTYPVETWYRPLAAEVDEEGERLLDDLSIDQGILAALDDIAARHRATPAQVALAWLIARPGITAPIASATSVEQLREILATGQRLIVVGGTGLYLNALTSGLAVIPPVPAEVRARADALIAEPGGLARMVADLDPDTRARIDLRNPARVQRAWEVLTASGRGLAAWQAETPPPLIPASAAERIVLTSDRDWLARRIERRFHAMMEQGALDEVRAMLPRWQPRALWARAIGAPELVAHLRGESTLDQAIERAIVATRQYAKAQRIFFRGRLRDWRQIPVDREN